MALFDLHVFGPKSQNGVWFAAYVRFNVHTSTPLQKPTFQCVKTKMGARRQTTSLLPYPNGHRDVEDLVRLKVIDVGQPLPSLYAYCHWVP